MIEAKILCRRAGAHFGSIFMEEVNKIYYERLISNQDLAKKDNKFADWFRKLGLYLYEAWRRNIVIWRE